MENENISKLERWRLCHSAFLTQMYRTFSFSIVFIFSFVIFPFHNSSRKNDKVWAKLGLNDGLKILQTANKPQLFFSSQISDY